MRPVPDWQNSQEMYDKAILEIGGTLKSLPDCYKNLKELVKKMLVILCMH